MPHPVPAAVKAQKALEEKGPCMQKALEEYFASQQDSAPPNVVQEHSMGTIRYGVQQSC